MTIPLIPDGCNVVVDRTNVHKYVQSYLEYELVESIKPQFEAFYRGFKRVFNTSCPIYVSFIKNLMSEQLPCANCFIFNIFCTAESTPP